MRHGEKGSSTVSVSLTTPAKAESSSIHFYGEAGRSAAPSPAATSLDDVRGAYRAALSALIEQIATGVRQHPVDLRLGSHVTSVIEAAEASLATGTAHEVRAADAAQDDDAAWGVTHRVLHTMAVQSGRRVVVIDDDPTGTQCLADVPVVTRWSVDDLRWGLVQPTTTCFVSTNTRSLSAAEAYRINFEVVANLASAATALGVDVSIISRSDSTLRGHFHPEIAAILAAWLEAFGRPIDHTLFCPAYPEAGRVTIDDVHLVEQQTERLPVAETEFAHDKTFGYRHSNLRDWMEERSGGIWRSADVHSISLDDIRLGGPETIARKIASSAATPPMLVNAVDGADLDVVAAGVLMLEREGKSVLCRTGPSFVRARSGYLAPAPLTIAQLASEMPQAARHGLVVAGSYTQKTALQVQRALEAGGLAEVEVAAPALLDPASAGAQVEQATSAVLRSLSDTDVVLRTSRDLVSGPTEDASQRIGVAVAAGLLEIVTRVLQRGHPAWVVAKGGITSSDVAGRGLRMRRAWVLGQMFAGQVAVWHEPTTGALCVIFPGNVGDPDSLALTVERLRLSCAIAAGRVSPRPASTQVLR
jgi:uncharacterized protein YgbK (DUF1537 family)